MRTWITNVDRRFIFSTINPLWAACVLDGFIPEKVILITGKNLERKTGSIRTWLTSIIQGYGKEPVFEECMVDEDDINSYSTSFIDLIEKEKGNEIALDITPGRKFMSAIMMSGGIKMKISRVYYLHLKDYSFVDRPFVIIPLACQKLKNIVELVERKK
ncbi:MAG: hypothetical protein WC556_13715 [Candidatus Methanoperedens sp.]